jgi:hypothetical protein
MSGEYFHISVHSDEYAAIDILDDKSNTDFLSIRRIIRLPGENAGRRSEKKS